MTVSEDSQRVNAFFESYRIAFERLDASAIADHFAYPCHITSDAREIVPISIAAKQDWTGEIERLLAMYRAIGFSSARIINFMSTELSSRLVQVLVHWALHDSVGRSLYNFQAMYTLAKVNDTLRITAISHNEIPRYRECLAQLQSQRTLGDSSPKGPDRTD